MPDGCKELERQVADSKCKCAEYRKLHPDCQCEECTVSDLSPGPVQNEEVLIRTVYSPIQYNSVTNEIVPASFRDARCLGLSVNRRSHTTEQELRSKVEDKIRQDINAGKNKDGFWRVVTANCGSIRSEKDDDGRRLFCAYDTAKEDDRSHADVCQNIDIPEKTPNRKSLRMRITNRLFEKFGKAVELHEVFSKPA